MHTIAHAAEVFIASYGAPALFAVVALESLGAPLPGESAIVIAAAAAARGEIDIRAVVLAAFLGAVIGDNAGYLIGRKLGRQTLVRYGGRFGVTDAAMAKAEAITARWGPLMVVSARFVVLLRQLNGLVAGSTGMPWLHFLAANVVGAALWVGVWTTLAYKLGQDTAIVPYLWHHLSLVAAVLVPALIVIMLLLCLRRTE